MKKIICLMLLGAAMHATVAAESDKSKKQASRESGGALSEQGKLCGHPSEDQVSTLMRIANDRPEYKLIFGATREGEETNNQEEIDCFASILSKMPDLKAQNHKGHDVLSIALLAHNRPIIDLIIKHLEQHPEISLNPSSQDLLNIYQHKPFKINLEALEGKSSFVHDMYRVANQSQNYQIINLLYDKFFKKELEPCLARKDILKELHPPLWAYNASQMKDYAVAIIMQLQGHIIHMSDISIISSTDHDKFKLPKNVNLQLRTSGKFLIEKDESIERILGRDHLEKAIIQLKLEDRLAVPQKYLVLRNGESLSEVTATIKIPSQIGKHSYLQLGGASNSVGIAIPLTKAFKGKVFAEYIEGTIHRSLPKDLENELRRAGFSDFTGGNFVYNEKDKKYYVIDTDNKNFLTPTEWPDNCNPFDLKSLSSDPRIEFVSIPITLKQDNAHVKESH